MLKIILLVLSCCGILVANDESMDVFRIPGDTIPLSYNLKFVDLLNDDFLYNGVTKILIQVKSTTSVLTLNAFELDIENVTVVDSETDREINVINFELIKKNEQLKVNLKEPWLIAGRKYNIEITYSGILRTDMTGLYRSSYKDEEYNVTRIFDRTSIENIPDQTYGKIYVSVECSITLDRPNNKNLGVQPGKV